MKIYERVPLKPAKAQEIIIDLFAGKPPVARKDIIAQVIDHYTQNGGLAPEGNPINLIRAALRNLKKVRQAENIDKSGYWKILPSDDPPGYPGSADEMVQALVEGMLSVIRDEIDTLDQQKSHLEGKLAEYTAIWESLSQK